MSPADVDARLQALSTLTPDAQHAARTRERCRAALQQRAQPARQLQGNSGANLGEATRAQVFRTVATGAVGLIWVAYVVALITSTLSLRAPMP
jgi:hypothetical protein